MPRPKVFTVHQVLAMLEDDDFTRADIFITLPIDANCSDEDSGDEAEGTCHNLTRRQLEAEAVATVKRGEERFRIDGGDESAAKTMSTVSETPSADCSTSDSTASETSATDDATVENTAAASSATTSRRRVSKPSLHLRESCVGDLSATSSTQMKAPSAGCSAPTCKPKPASATKRTADSESDVPAAKTKRDEKPLKADKAERKWVTKDLPKSCMPAGDIHPNAYRNTDYTPTTLFEQFFNDEVILDLIENTNKYATQKGKHSFQTTPNEFRLFLAILFNSGYAPLPRRRLYWEPTDDVHNAAISNAMTRNRFEDMMSCVHVADNENLADGDRFAKVRPLFTALNAKFLDSFPRQKNISIDESMIPYYGRHSLKQYIRGKPIRFGYKVWSANTPLGYCAQLDPYQGAGVTHHQLGLGGSVVIKLVSALPTDHYVVYFDNFFTSLKLLQHLSTQNIHATGTVQANRVEDCPVTPVDKFKKFGRGTEEHRLDTQSNIIVTRWNDNSVVTVASNCHGVEPIGTVQRWSRAENKAVDIPQPYLISMYNKNMAGVDRMDQNIATYRISIRSRKWWWPLFAYLIDVAMQNAWLLYRLTDSANHQPMDQLEFRRNVVNVYYKKYSLERACIGRPLGRPKTLNQRAPTEVHKEGKHYIEAIGMQRRCTVCGLKEKKQCKKCNVGLHIDCFEAFHEMQ